MTIVEELDNIGCSWVRGAFDQQALEKLKPLLDTGSRPGDRLDREKVSHLKKHINPVIGIAGQLLPECKIVQAITFNKSEETNWSVGWHQDRVIAVAERHDVIGYNNWTNKKGIWYCEPPTHILENMIFARIHVTDSNEENGCVQIAAGSHLKGRIQKSYVSRIVEDSDVVTCKAKAGDILLGKALLIHRSKPSRSNSPRTALRIDFANQALDAPIQWAFASQTF